MTLRSGSGARAELAPHRKRPSESPNSSEGVAIARQMFARVKGMVEGVQVSAPLGKVEVALELFA
jgi:methionine synthase / methylenetetrahydrofolate reductase(NADPH)